MIRHIITALGAAAFVAAGMGSSEAAAFTRTNPGTGCIRTNTLVNGNYTQICGYVNDEAASALAATAVYVDFNRTLNATATISACRRGYNNASFNCQPGETSGPTTGSVDYGLINRWNGLIGQSDVWDYFSIQVTYANTVGGQTQVISMWGIGATG